MAFERKKPGTVLWTSLAAVALVAFEVSAAAVDDSKQPAAVVAEPGEKVGDVLPPAEKHRRLRFRQIAERYKDNRAAFAFGKCRISSASHQAETLKDALAGKWNEQRQRPPYESTTC